MCLRKRKKNQHTTSSSASLTWNDSSFHLLQLLVTISIFHSSEPWTQSATWPSPFDLLSVLVYLGSTFLFFLQKQYYGLGGRGTVMCTLKNIESLPDVDSNSQFPTKAWNLWQISCSASSKFTVHTVSLRFNVYYKVSVTGIKILIIQSRFILFIEKILHYWLQEKARREKSGNYKVLKKNAKCTFKNKSNSEQSGCQNDHLDVYILHDFTLHLNSSSLNSAKLHLSGTLPNTFVAHINKIFDLLPYWAILY